MSKISLFIAVVMVSSWSHAGNPFIGRNHKLGLGLDYWQYEEPGVMEDKGPLLGAEYEFRNVFSDYLFTQFSMDLFLGRTQYDGRDLASGEPLQFEQTNFMSTLQAYLGVAIENGNGWAIIPKIGLLYRMLTDANDEFGGDYQRDQEYFVIPIGLEVVHTTHDYRQWTVGGWISTHFSGVNKTYFTDVGGDEDLKFKQDIGRGFEIYGTYTFARYYITANIRHWKVADSELKRATVPALGTRLFLEPENETLAVGTRIGIHF